MIWLRLFLIVGVILFMMWAFLHSLARHENTMQAIRDSLKGMEDDYREWKKEQEAKQQHQPQVTEMMEQKTEFD